MACDKIVKNRISPDISESYINARGQLQEISLDIQQQLYQAMGGDIPHQKQIQRTVPAVKVVSQGEPISLPIQGNGEFDWQLTTEDGKLWHQGHLLAEQALVLPVGLPLGYHNLQVIQKEKTSFCRIIVTPKRCYLPKVLLEERKLWGASVQLYSLRSDNNWGIGDFGDLKQMINEVGRRGGSFVGLNPIHSLFPANPESASPYSPSSRCWFNIIYIDVTAVEDFKHSQDAQLWWHSHVTQADLAAVREIQHVDYTRVTQLKLTALKLAWQSFLLRNKHDKQRVEFELFIQQRGESLHWQAAFDALHIELMAHDPSFWGWPVWPEEYREAQSPAVTKFCQTHAEDVQFWCWLQWLAWCQFANCWQHSRELNMPIGLYRDMAVGVTQGGVETWSDRELYSIQASIGAPPDILGPLGQNWGVAPINPHVLVERGYMPFIDLLRANMENCGALRIDHVMSLLRLWWVPQGESAANGAYVSYPVDDLLAILALESQRMRCMVIGEDLGIVPAEIISKLRDYGVFSYKVLWFEHDDEKKVRAPEQWAVQAMAVITTHDLPTMRGYWESYDFELGEQLGLYPDPVMLEELRKEREIAKQHLLDALQVDNNLKEQTVSNAALDAMSLALNQKIHHFVAGTNSALLGLQPEDWQDMLEPVNIPGTSTEYANWRRKLTQTLEEMFASEQVNALLEDVNQQRKNIQGKCIQ